MKNKNWVEVASRLAPKFTGVHWFGFQDRQKEIEVIKNLNIESYQITGLDVHESEDTMTVTYWVAVTETLNGARVKLTPFPRMSVWKKISDQWVWTIHANLSPVEDRVMIKPRPNYAQKEYIF